MIYDRAYNLARSDGNERESSVTKYKNRTDQLQIFTQDVKLMPEKACKIDGAASGPFELFNIFERGRFRPSPYVNGC